MSNTRANEITGMALRQRKVRDMDPAALLEAIHECVSHQNCIAKAHIGEAVDRAGHIGRLQEAANVIKAGGRVGTRMLHHEHGLVGECTEYCLVLDYVKADQAGAGVGA